MKIAEVLGDLDTPLVTADYGAVRVLVLNRPAARNALTRSMRRDFAERIAAAEADPMIGALVLTGADPAFSAGVDLRERAAGPPQPPVKPNPGRVLRGLSKPSIAAVNGACVTGALEMVLSCGFAIASERARFADTHARVGLFPRWGGAALLARGSGARRARQLMLSGLPVDAGTALAWGLVNEVLPHGELLDRALELAGAIAANRVTHPFTFALHLDTLRAIDDADCQAVDAIEKAALARFDAGPTAPTQDPMPL